MDMTIGVGEILAGKAREIPFAFELDGAELEIAVDGYEIVGPVRVKGRIFTTGLGLRVDGDITCSRRFACDRCLTETTEDEALSFAEEISGDVRPDESVLDGERADLAPLVRDTIIAGQPLAKLCKPDCKGLCPVCGQNLNEGTCHCETKTLDPRLTVLAQLLDKKH